MTNDFKGSITKKIFEDNVKVIILLEFIVGEYTFSLPVEFVLVPLVGIVAALDAIAKTDQKHPSVRKFTTAIQSLFGFLIVSSAVMHAVNDYKSLATLDSLRKIIMLPILSLSLAPYIYVLLLWTSYESLFVHLKINTIKQIGVERYAKRMLIFHLMANLKSIREFTSTYGYRLATIQTKGDVDKLMESEI